MFCEENRHNQYQKAGCNHAKCWGGRQVGVRAGWGERRNEKGSWGKMMHCGLGILILTAGPTNRLPAGLQALGKMKAFP